jgi:uncharacterized protein (DUF4415 family)
MAKTKLSESSRRGERTAKKKSSTGKITRHGSLENLPKLSDRELRRLKALSKLPDSEIDLSDIPEITPEMFRNAIRGNPYLRKKQQLTVRLDADVLDWLKGMGRGYQTKLNALLREAMRVSREGKRAG